MTTNDGMPVEVPSVSGGHRYIPSLDGLRALAVAGVIAYHFNFHWANGGYLGVDFFFVLSGFLITSLLVGEWGTTRSIGLRSFWARRAKRLLPAVLVLLLVLTLYDWAGGPNISAASFRPDAIATLFYYANWHLIFSHQSYFAQFAVPSPLKHTWSLAIEEQFYLVWPVAVLMMFRWAKRRRPPGGDGFPRRLALVITTVLAVASAVEMAVLFRQGADPSRIYYGTDTRGFELFIGAILAIVLTGRPDHSPTVRRALHAAGAAAAVALGFFWVTAGDDQGNPSAWMYRGGLVVAGILAAVVIASVTQPDSGPLGGVLAIRPLRWVGRVSYGLYLWHWPVYVLMTDITTGLGGAALLAARLSATVFATSVSYYLIERPIRRYRWKGWPFTVATVSAVGICALAIVAGTGSEVATAVVPPNFASVRVVSPTARPDPLPPPIDLPAGQTVSPATPLRVVTIGDSVMFDAELGISAALSSTGEATVTTHGFPGWGLINDPNFAHDLTALIQQVHPQLIIGMWSWDNAYAAAHPVAYTKLINEAVQTMLAPGNGVEGVAFLQFPTVGPLDSIIDPTTRERALQSQNANTRAWTTIVSQLPSQYPGRVTFLPVASSLELHGQYSAWLPTVSGGWIRARNVDNTHLCPAGAAVLGAAVTEQLTPMFRLAPPAAGWINGKWTSDVARYHVPPNGCPNDQPPPGQLPA
ncbi:MAG TPA: acyltransferase [Acidimicrobiales bacterium]|nr:acyltransferase [Acidimicrobiales bacterium]